jgi:hypothetical protein
MEGRRVALVIAVSEYVSPDLKPLYYCKNDGDELSEFLKSKIYEIPDKQKLIGKVNYQTMKDAIDDFFTDSNLKTDDILFFYYSGHGIPHAYGRTYLASSEIDPSAPHKRGFPFEDLTYLINSSNSSKIVTILDCCYSGAAKLSKGQENAAATIGAEVINDKKEELQGEGKYLLAASQAYQEAYGLLEKGHSIFTYYLLEGLKGNKDAINKNGDVTPSALGKYVYDMIVNLPVGKKLNQKPILKAEESGDFPLVSYPYVVEPNTAANKATIVSMQKQLLELSKELSDLENGVNQMLYSDNKDIVKTIARSYLLPAMMFKDDYRHTMTLFTRTFPDRGKRIEEADMELSRLIESLIDCLKSKQEGLGVIEQVITDLRRQFDVLLESIMYLL